MVLVTGFSLTSFAAEEDNIPKEGVLYTLTYPDGTRITSNEEGAPLEYADVTNALKEENWILLGSGFRSDANGKATLPAAWTEGTIRIVETKVPEGYTRGTESEKVTDLKAGSVKFINPRESITPGKKGKTPGTGDRVNLLPLSVLLILSALGLSLLIKRRLADGVSAGESTGSQTANKVLLALIIAAACMLTAASAYAAGGFTINKVDDVGDPVEGAIFDVYGKPTVTYETIADKTMDITLTKTWNDENNKDGIRPNTEAFKNAVELSYTTSNSTNETKITDPAPQVKDNGNNTYTVTWKDVPMYEKDGEERSFGVGESEIEGYTLGEISGDAQSGFKVTNTYKPSAASTDINVGLSYRIYDGGKWDDVINGSQTVTVSGNGMDPKILTFDPVNPGDNPQKVTLPGAGSYTIAMKEIADGDLQPEEKLKELDAVMNAMPIFIDTVTATVTVDENGNCTVSGTTGKTYVIGYSNNGDFIYNVIDDLKATVLGTIADGTLDTLNPHSPDAGAAASGNTVTLTTVMSQAWDDNTTVIVM